MAGLVRCMRSLVKPLLVVASIIVAALFTYQSVLPLVAFFFPVFDPLFYELGVYGPYPVYDFASFQLQPPRPQLTRWDPRCDAGFVLLTPNGPSVPRPGPMILDSQGELVWMSSDFGPSANLQIQTYRGQQFLTFWAGEKAATSGKGKYYMLDSTYQVVRTFSAVGSDLYGDLHEFKFTNDNTALLTVYNVTTADLSPMGRPKQGWIIDSVFQEIDIESGELLFQWKASEHVDPNQSYMTNPLGGYVAKIPFDFYHINSIDKDHHGNYLISSRHFHSITCIAPDGNILWTLGGRHNDFHDLSDGLATNFKWQHDARWISSEEGILTLFDNGKGGTLHTDAPYSRALVLQLDIANRTATLLNALTSDHQKILAGSQGAMQILPGSAHLFVGWGSAAAYSEYAPDGQLLCETHLAASAFFSWERMKSYRTVKALHWHAVPREPPHAVVVAPEAAELYVSWNGATEVAFWALEGDVADELMGLNPDVDLNNEAAGGREQDRANTFVRADVIARDGFESVFDLGGLSKKYARYRVAALDRHRNVLAYSNLVEVGSDASSSIFTTALFTVFGLVALFVSVRLLHRRFHLALSPWLRFKVYHALDSVPLLHGSNV